MNDPDYQDIQAEIKASTDAIETLKNDKQQQKESIQRRLMERKKRKEKESKRKSAIVQGLQVPQPPKKQSTSRQTSPV